MSEIGWITSDELLVGAGHATETDTINRALQEVFTASGVATDVDPFTGFYSVVSLGAYGAVGDGSTDDTAAIQAAINANPSNTRIVGGGKTYRITSQLTIPVGSVRLHLTEMNFSVIGDITLLGVASTVVYFFQLDHCLITSATQTTVGQPIIDFSGFSNSRFAHLKIVGTADTSIAFYGAGLVAATSPYYNVIDQCQMEDLNYGVHCDDSGGSGTGVESLRIRDCRIHPATSNYGVYISRYSLNVNVQGCVFSSTGGTGVYTDGQGSVITGNWFETLTLGIDVGTNAINNQLSPNFWDTNGANFAFAGSSQSNNLILGDATSTNPAHYVPGDLTTQGHVLAAGGYRQTIDGWYQDNVAASQSNVALTRSVRFVAPRAGSITAVCVAASEARTAGTLTITVYKNTGLVSAAGSTIGLTAVLDGTNTSRKATTQAINTDTFVAGDEIYAVITTDGSWAPITSDVRVSIEVET